MPQLTRPPACSPRADKVRRRLETDKKVLLSIVATRTPATNLHSTQTLADIESQSSATRLSTRRLPTGCGITGKPSWARFNARSGARSADVVLSRALLGDLPPLDHSLDTYSLRCGRKRVWARIFAEPVLLLFLLFDHQASHPR